MKSFKYEPVAVAAVLSSLSALLVSFGLDFLSADQATWIAAAITAVVGAFSAFRTSETPFVLIAAAVKAVAIVAVSYGLNLTQEQIAGLVVAIESVGALAVTRPQVSPVV
jgi:uncharacterized protein (DUF1778 family)